MIAQHSALVDPILDRIVGPTLRTSLLTLLGAVGIVLLIACANVTNLFLVRVEGRHRELAVRRALGATRTQLVRLQLSEGFLVAFLAGVVAVVLSVITLPLFLRAAPEGIPRLATGFALRVHGVGVAGVLLPVGGVLSATAGGCFVVNLWRTIDASPMSAVRARGGRPLYTLPQEDAHERVSFTRCSLRGQARIKAVAHAHAPEQIHKPS